MDAASIINTLDDAGIRLRLDGDSLYAEPKAALTDDTRAQIRDNKAAIVAMLYAASIDMTAQYRASLQTGRTVLCVTCQHFAHRPSRMPDGYCNQLQAETWARVPFACPAHQPLHEDSL